MGSASASATSSGGQQSSGGNIVNNPSSQVPWIVAAVVAVIGLVAWLLSRKKGSR